VSQTTDLYDLRLTNGIISIKEAHGIRTVENLRRVFGITDPDDLEVELCYQIPTQINLIKLKLSSDTRDSGKRRGLRWKLSTHRRRMGDLVFSYYQGLLKPYYRYR
jgi:hypothetical protein